jgi:hypothetical protein
MQDGVSSEFFFVVGAFGLMAAFLVGQVMHGIMHDQGFGVLGNALVLASGFVIGLAAIDRLGYGSAGVDRLTAIAIGAAFGVLVLLAFVKRFVLRL